MKMPCLLIVCLFSLWGFAQSPKMKDLETKRKALLAEIENTNQLLNENNKSIQNGLNRLNLVAQQIQSRQELVQILEKEINVLNEDIRKKEQQVQGLEKNLQMKKKNYTISIQRMYRQKNNQDQLIFILSADHLAKSFRRMLYLKEYAQWQKKQAVEIVTQQDKLETEKQKLLRTKTEKVALADIKKHEEDTLMTEENTQKAAVATLQKNKKKLQEEINKRKNQAAALDREIEKFIKADISKAEKAAKADTKTERKAEIKGGFAMTKEEQQLSSSFAANKGKLPFPLKGNYRIVNRFGAQQYGNLEHTRFNSNGIDLRTTPDNTAKAVFNGVVTGVFVIPGLQKSVIIRHGNYLTFYSYLEQVFVKEGDKVTTGQNIGKIYTDEEDGNSTILHFEIWKEQTKLNPEPWLNK
jgi:septal ring factor EnvC (AmiA/AmiB activator)